MISIIPLFSLGQVVATAAVLPRISDEEMSLALWRHVHGDWGDISEEASRVNEDAVKTKDQIRSVYHTHGGIEFWVVTEADWSYTTVLLPEEY